MLFRIFYIVLEKYLDINTSNASNETKVKVKLSLCLTKHHTTNAYWVVEA